ncbi:MAG: MBL fold metallo-hydrolase [Verrucomicrobiia bacterium]|jgi:L-ascorbate metabolism protein UlaG (beta-lactamase superfamily)|tara:strand:- start:996 stop:1721 length:726 start_codon:yes stop_codon:yes gene_type:complete
MNPLRLIILLAFLLSGGLALAAEEFKTAKGKLIITPINHATLVIEWNGKTIYVDPVGQAAWYKAFPKPDLVLLTHIHGDHYRAAILQAVVGPKTQLVASPTLASVLEKELKAKTITVANGASTDKVGFKLEAVASYNTTPPRKRFHPKGQGNGYVLNLGGKRIYLSGDTEGTPEMLALKDIDVAFLCMNLPYTMDVAAAAKAVRAFKPKVVYPYHSRGQDTVKFKALVGDAAEVRLRDWYK